MPDVGGTVADLDKIGNTGVGARVSVGNTGDGVSAGSTGGSVSAPASVGTGVLYARGKYEKAERESSRGDKATVHLRI